MVENEKWTVLTKGNEEVWTKEKVEQYTRTGTIYMRIAGFTGLITIIFLIWSYFTSGKDILIFILEYLWAFFIVAITFIVGSYGEKLCRVAKNAKEIHEVKNKKE